MRRYGVKPVRYYQRLIALLEQPETEREHAMLVKRLRRLADQNRAARATRRF